MDWLNTELKNLTVLISGTGTTLGNICRHCYEDGGLLKSIAQVACVVSNHLAAPGLEIAHKYGALVKVVERNKRDEEPLEAWQARLNRCMLCEPLPDLIVLAGFTALIKVPQKYEGRVLNVHPSLIPKHCGKGMYGRHVHEAVLAAGDTVTGCTVHVVDDEYDHGPVLGQRQVQISEGETVETLTEKIKAAERELYPQMIRNMLVSNDLHGQK